jgi:C4-dicarboxylate-specific signal transduction histidine kinase
MQLTISQQPLASAAALVRRAANNPVAAIALALVLMALVAALDYATGYELRFAVLYLLPIALATWAGGMHAGVLIAALSSLFWLVSFRTTHPYSGELFFYWEHGVMMVVYLAFAVLIARLRVALIRADERFLLVLEELHAAVYVADQDSGKILYANRSLARMLNADPRAMSAADLGKRFAQGDQGAESARCEPANGGFVSREVRDETSGRWYLVQVGPIPWKSSRPVCLHVITDIGEQKHAQVLKRQHRDMLHQTARLAALSEFAASLAHEVNQPLMAIASYNGACLRMIEAGGFDQNELVTALQGSRDQALRAGRIIGRVRDFFRSRQPQASYCDINALVRESLELMETQLEDHSMLTVLSLSGTLPMVQVDQTLLVQVIVNLLQNAIDAMEESPPSRRRLRVSTALDNNGAIELSVADKGSGIPAAIGERLYTPFFTTKSKGLGLGLSICRSIVEAHGGRLWHSANPDSGCTFHFTLPLEGD